MIVSVGTSCFKVLRKDCLFSTLRYSIFAKLYTLFVEPILHILHTVAEEAASTCVRLHLDTNASNGIRCNSHAPAT